MVSLIKNKASKQYLSSRFAFFHKQIKKTKLTKLFTYLFLIAYLDIFTSI